MKDLLFLKRDKKTFLLINFSCFSLPTHSAMSNHDPWNGLATLMTLLETVVDANKDYLVLGKDEGVYYISFINLLIKKY